MMFLFLEFGIPADESGMSKPARIKYDVVCAVMSSEVQRRQPLLWSHGESVMGRGHFELGLEG